MTVFRISVRKMSGENSHRNEENTVKMIQIDIEPQKPKLSIAGSFHKDHSKICINISPDKNLKCIDMLHQDKKC